MAKKSEEEEEEIRAESRACEAGTDLVGAAGPGPMRTAPAPGR
jgi:hypothetical protein